jgi:hypothetical protein
MDRLSFIGSYLGAFDGDRAPPVTSEWTAAGIVCQGGSRRSHHTAPTVP